MGTYGLALGQAGEHCGGCTGKQRSGRGSESLNTFVEILVSANHKRGIRKLPWKPVSRPNLLPGVRTSVMLSRTLDFFPSRTRLGPWAIQPKAKWNSVSLGACFDIWFIYAAVLSLVKHYRCLLSWEYHAWHLPANRLAHMLRRTRAKKMCASASRVPTPVRRHSMKTKTIRRGT